MKRLFLAGLWALMLLGLVPGIGYGQIPYDIRDFYQYEDGIVKRLEMAPKIFVRLLMEFNPEARAKFISELAPVSQEKVRGDDSALLFGFDGSVPLAEIVQKINKIHHPTAVEARPVFWVNNIEAVVDGIVVEPKTPLTELEIRNRIARFGKFEVIKSVADNEGRVFFIGDIALPLNLFILSNLVHKDTWIRRAYPHFRYLHDPIVSEFRVEPISGTVGEPRKFVWAIHIFDPKIALHEQRLPSFGEGQFMPMQLTPTQYGSSLMTPPANYLFKSGRRERVPDVIGKRNRTVTFVWPFRHYALGEWTVASQLVAYEKDGVSETIASSPAKFVVMSLIGDLGIKDMPSPTMLRLPEKKISEPSLELPALPVYWFDRWVKNPDRLAFYVYKMSSVFWLLAGVMFVALLYPKAQQWYDQKQARRKLREEIFGLCDTAEGTLTTNSYEFTYAALAKILSSAFPQLSHHPTVGEIKDSKEVVDVFGDSWPDVKSLLEELEKKSAKDFKPNPDVAKKLIERVRELATWLDSKTTVKGSAQ